MGAFRKIALSLLILYAAPARAQEAVLEDRNGDGVVTVLGFGDSLTFGLGDGIPPGQFVEEVPTADGRGGYPARIELLIGVPVENRGIPGEEIDIGGVQRFPGTVRTSAADVIVIFEGTNDSIKRINAGVYEADAQRMINVARALGRTPVIATLPTPCCRRAGREPFTTAYSAVSRDLARVNGIALVDLERAWNTTCVNKNECELYNLPEGLHPNSLGYDVMAQTVLAALYGVDIFAPDGAAQLESAAGLEPGTVLVRPGS